MTQTLRIGTRGSKLSLWQANHIADLFRARFADVETELVIIKTRGDVDRESSLSSLGGRGLFTAEIESALRRAEVDCAVHSLKDLPTAYGGSVAIGLIPKRGDHRDALVSRGGQTLEQLPRGARVGTGSPRRRAQLLRLRPDLEVRDIRGNVPTRLQKLFAPEGPYDAIILAVAGLERLEMSHCISEIFEIDRMTNAAGQGALAAQCINNGEWTARFMTLNHYQTAFATEAERAFLGAVSGGCSAPVGAYAHIANGMLKLQARVISPDGAEQIDVSDEVQSFDGPAGKYFARKLGERLAEQALEQGAARILQDLTADTD